jgi:hypothetical protein
MCHGGDDCRHESRNEQGSDKGERRDESKHEGVVASKTEELIVELAIQSNLFIQRAVSQVSLVLNSLRKPSLIGDFFCSQ